MDSNQPRSSPIPPPSGMPEFANRPPPSVVPPRPPVFHPTAGDSKKQSPSGNPFARPTPTLERSPLPKPTPPNFAPPPAYVTLPPAPVETRKPPSSIPLEARTETNKSPSPIPVQKPAEPVKTADVPLTPPSPQPLQASPPTSPAVLPTNEEKEEKVKAEERVDMTGGLVSWLTNKVAESKLLSDVAEKTKHGIEQVLTTLDPGMRGFLSDDGTVELYVVATDSDTVRAIKDGFERVFASVLIRAVPAATENLPPLVNGSAYALEMCGERSSRVFISKQVPASAPVLVMQPFIMQIENRQMTATRMLLEWKGNLVDSFSQLLPVDSKVMQVLEARQKADGKQAQDFSIPVSQAIKEVHSGPNPPFSELLENGAAALAQQFMSLTMEQTTASSP